MLKFSKHIFSIFLICTIVPLFIMFLIQNYNISNDMNKKEEIFLSRGLDQLNKSANDYLLSQNEFTERIVKKFSEDKISTEEYKQILEAEQVYFINSNTNKTESFFDLKIIDQSKRPELVIVTIVPVGSKSLYVVKKVEYTKLYPQGPFNLEIYAYENIDKNNLIIKFNDSFAPSVFGDKSFLNGPPSPPIEESQNYKTIQLTDSSGKVISTLVLRINVLPPPPINILLQFIALLALFGGVLSSFFIGRYIKKNFIQPFLLISDASKKVQSGDFSLQLDYDFEDSEAGQTISRFNNMIKELKEKEELRNSFIASLTHDLRTPLIANERVIEYILEEFKALNLEDQYKLAKGLYSNNEHLLRMVNLLLESYHFDATQVKICPTDINLSELFEECIENVKSLAQNKDVKIKNLIIDNSETIKTDKVSLKRILINLLANAVESIQNGGEIILNAFFEDNYVKILVEDNGPGVAIAEKEHIFEKYYSGKSEQRKLGYGLGLYICKKLAELNNGQIEIESELGKYTKFIVMLPKS